MTRVLAKNGLKSCWSCGGGKLELIQDNESEKYPYIIRCKECGETTLNCATRKQAKDAWNSAYEIPVA